jgi:hypothetical protein
MTLQHFGATEDGRGRSSAAWNLLDIGLADADQVRFQGEARP